MAARRSNIIRRGAGSQKLARVVQTLPVTLPAALAAFSIIALAHLLIGQFKVGLILPVGIPAAFVAGYYAHKMSLRRPGRPRVQDGAGFDGLVLVGITLWLAFNLLFTSQHLFTNRDPATYNLAGVWLINHQNLQIEKPAALADLNVPGLGADSLGFATDPNNSNELQAQGAHLLPALQGLAGKVFGINGVLRINVVFGAVALLAFYGFSRLVIRPRWAALGTLVMSLSLPMLFLSRDSYTEPLTMTFLFGGLALLAYAQRARVRWQWGLAGLVLGAAALTRIDVYLAFAGIAAYASIMLMLAPKRQRRGAASCAAWLAAGMFVGGYLGWLDVSMLSTYYYQAHSNLILPELRLLLGLVVLGAVAAALNWRFDFLATLDKLTSRWRDRLVLAAVGGFFLVLASRPAWFTGYQTNAAGVMSRTFSEQTLNWIIWYVGPVVMVAGVAGAALVIVRLLRGRDKLLLPFMLTLAAMALLYFVKPDITGDQPWATRRFLPIVIPGFVLLSMWALERLFSHRTYTWRGRRYDLEIIAAVLATLAAVSPLFVTYPFALRRLYVPELAQMRAICAAVPKGAVVVWAGDARLFATQPTRTICGTDSLGLDISQSSLVRQNLAALSEQARLSHKQVIVGFFASDAKLLPITPGKNLVTTSISYHEIEHTYKRPPRNLITLHQTISIGTLDEKGSIE